MPRPGARESTIDEEGNLRRVEAALDPDALDARGRALRVDRVGVAGNKAEIEQRSAGRDGRLETKDDLGVAMRFEHIDGTWYEAGREVIEAWGRRFEGSTRPQPATPRDR